MDPKKSATYQTYAKVMGWADKARKLRVRTNADTPEDAQRAREFGAEGIGLCRTEHMFFEHDRIVAVRRMILASTSEELAAQAEQFALPANGASAFPGFLPTAYGGTGGTCQTCHVDAELRQDSTLDKMVVDVAHDPPLHHPHLDVGPSVDVGGSEPHTNECTWKLSEVIGLSVKAGDTVLARMPKWPKSLATHSIIASPARLVPI